MLPVKRIEGSGLQASQRKLLQRLAKHKQPAAKKVQDDFLVVGGDNKAESGQPHEAAAQASEPAWTCVTFDVTYDLLGRKGIVAPSWSPDHLAGF